mgnify:CR=1 FL=1
MTLSYIEDTTNKGNENKSKGSKKRADQIAAVVLFLFACYITYGALKMPLFDKYGPSAGLFPLIVGISLAILASSLFLEAVNPRLVDGPSPFPQGKEMIAPPLVIISLIGYTLVISHLGYLLTTFIFVIFLMGVVQRNKFITSLMTSITICALLFLIFEIGLGVRLPKGPFGF